jgi:glycosyltransferase involved in cell wall biosynthesis
VYEDKKVKVLMLGWEFPPFTIGGLGIASYSIAKYVSSLGNKVIFVVPFSHKSLKKIKSIDFLEFDTNFEIIGTSNVFFDSYFSFKSEEEMLYFLNNLINDLKINSLSTKKLADLLYNNISQKIELFKKKVLNYYSNRALNFDVIHCHDWPTIEAGIALKEKSKKPLFIHVHSTEMDRSNFNPDPFKFNIEKKGYEKADKIFAISKRIKNIIVNYYGINPDKIEIVYNGIELKKEHFDFSVLKKKKEKGYKIVLFLARLTIMKNPDLFIRVAKLVVDYYKKHNKKEKVLFVIAGTGEKLPELVHLAVNLGIADKIFFTGYLRGKEVEEAYKLADVFVLTSISEPFGLTPLEAIAMGKCPVIVSKQSGVAEVLKHCFKVDFWDEQEFANKIIALLEHEPLQKEIVKNAFEELKNINWLKSAKKIVKTYLEVLKRFKMKQN